MRSNMRILSYLVIGLGVFIAPAAIRTVSSAEESQAEKPSGNSKCYVCHPSMKTEELTTKHLPIGVTCDVCHGESVEHMHDEMLMTKPDLLFGRSEVRAMCSKCHKPRGQHEFYQAEDHKNPAVVEAFLEKWTGRMRPNGRGITKDSVCTDCHGTHNITKPAKTQAEDAQSTEWKAVFNGQDLAGWKPSGQAAWTVKAGRINVTPAGGDDGSLWTETTYENYLLTVTFKATWPIHAGVWLRGGDSQQGPRVEISDSKTALTGSVWTPKGLVMANLREDLVDKESWNTLSVRLEAERIQVWLNGQEIGAVRTAGPATGKIGLYIAKSPASKPADLSVREVLVQQLTPPEAKTAANP